MKLGFIGMGNMASALAGGFIRSGKLAPADIIAFDPYTEGLLKKAEQLGFTPAGTAAEAVKSADVVLLACKPHQVETAIAPIRDLLRDKALLSIALGWDFAKYQTILPGDARVQFIMPNTPAMVGEGVFLFEQTHSLLAEELQAVKALFAAVGKVSTLPSHLMEIGGALTGCGPAFVDLMLEAFADAAVKYGIPREQAITLTAQMVLGSAKLQQETGLHPGVLKDMVCSPGGSTIKGVTALEQAGYRAACISAIDAIMKK
ncbi:MAG: pyrroline-5-carboxylate reductase [Ruminococcaceae bacterium]|nr:pyrroline-5-carboxylate reductase [Oscillospiraceae bacterium]